MYRKLGSAVVVGISFLRVLECQYTGALTITLAGVSLRSFCDTCNKVACDVIRFGDSILQYCVVFDVDNSSLLSSIVYFQNVLSGEVLLFMLVLQ
jgi:hypothetical protein